MPVIGADPALVRAALRRLIGAPAHIGQLDRSDAEHAGLYALYASSATWRELGLGPPPNKRPLYVGKAEGTFASRDIRGHFGITDRKGQSPTGGSTVRRS